MVDLWRVLLLSGADTFGLSKLMSCMMNWFAPFTEHLKIKERMELMLAPGALGLLAQPRLPWA